MFMQLYTTESRTGYKSLYNSSHYVIHNYPSKQVG